MEELINKYFCEKGIALSDKQVKSFVVYSQILLEWNREFNLTRITDPKEIVIKHFLDSVLPYEIFDKNSSVLDVGTGAGFPAIPLAILNPSMQFTLVDSLLKRINFVNEVIKTLELKNATAIHSRVEVIVHDKNYRNQYNYTICRAVAKLPTLCELCLPFLKMGGKMIVYKSKEVESEIIASTNALALCGGVYREQKSYELPEYMGKREIVIIEKINDTPIRYPRGSNKPTKTPL